MNYIVLDLEWNQASFESSSKKKKLPYEIIEIGAVKLNERYQKISEFQCFIKPVVHKKLQAHVRELLAYDEKMLAQGVSFSKAVDTFFDWCDENYVFCTWGTEDLTQLQRNLEYHKLKTMEFPLYYYDIQQIFAHNYHKQDVLALYKAVEELSLPQDYEYHMALNDAKYTAMIMGKMNLSKKNFLSYTSLDYYKIPSNSKEEISLLHLEGTEYITREFQTKKEAASDRKVRKIQCFLCQQVPSKRLRWFQSSPTVYYALARCKTHGMLLGKLKLKSRENGGYFVVRTVTLAEDEVVNRVMERYQELKEKSENKQESGTV